MKSMTRYEAEPIKPKERRSGAANSEHEVRDTNQAPCEALALNHSFCCLPDVRERPMPDVLDPLRERIILNTRKKWANGTILKYHFLDSPVIWAGSEEDKEAVREAFQEWKDVGIGLEFAETHIAEDAQIRIGFYANAGSWSYVGRDAVDLVKEPRRRTMNFGWPLTTEYGFDTALHEIGHALGFHHEHQNSQAGIVWDEDAVIAYFSGPPNHWKEAEIRRNILSPLPPAEVDGTNWDRDSIMHYHFPAGVIQYPTEYQKQPLIPVSGLSQMDQDAVAFFYPPLASTLPVLPALQTEQLNIAAGQQLDFKLDVTRTGQYSLATFGVADTILTLFEQVNGELLFVAGDDDSGYDRNSRIQTRLTRGQHYVMRVRLNYAQAGGSCAVMWY